MALFVGPVPEDKLPKDATAGRLLAGSVTLAKPDNGGSAGAGRPGAVFDASNIAPGCVQCATSCLVQQDRQQRFSLCQAYSAYAPSK
jgi:hypothetical protein